MGRSFVYLDHSATSWPKPEGVARAIESFLAHDAGNAARSGYALARRASGVIERTRSELARLVGMETPERVLLQSSCTDALNLAVHGVVESAHRRAERVHAVVHGGEHNAVLRPIEDERERGRLDVTVVMPDATGRVEARAMLAAVRAETALVALQHASNATGALQPVAEVGEGLRAMGSEALLLVDAAQTAGVLPVSMAGLGADLLAFGSHKGLLGVTGLGALVASERVIPDVRCGDEGARMAPVRQGGTGDSRLRAMPRELARRFEAGSPNGLACAALLGAMESETPACPERLARERGLYSAMLEGLRAISGVLLYGPEVSERLPVAAFTVEGYDSAEVGTILDGSFGVAVRAGLHCAPGVHEAMGVGDGGTVRASIGWNTTEQDVERFLEGVRAIAAAIPGTR
ncbi:MAG: aminotransferase class V-fold PLP-dependent enzyme [Phycisphaeraceae bacterium]|nr:MAG: aminotransferase class V-fold PLP-dependent enzyme [Phycisphaeraceae bacterium]